MLVSDCFFLICLQFLLSPHNSWLWLTATRAVVLPSYHDRNINVVDQSDSVLKLTTRWRSTLTSGFTFNGSLKKSFGVIIHREIAMLRNNSNGLHQLHILMTRNLYFKSSSIFLIFWPIVFRHFLAQPHSGHPLPKRKKSGRILGRKPKQEGERPPSLAVLMCSHSISC